MTINEAITDGLQSSGLRWYGFDLKSPTEGRARVNIDLEFQDYEDFGWAGRNDLVVLKLELILNGASIDKVTLYGESKNNLLDMDWSHPKFEHQSQSDDWTWSKH